MMTSYFRIGGWRLNRPGLADRVHRFVRMLPARIDEYENLLTATASGWPHAGNRNAFREGRRSRWASGADAARFGVAYDVRKVFPYASYDEFDFDVPTQTAGDCYARYQVRVAEMRESLKIVRQAMEKDSARRADSRGRAGNHSSATREDEDGNGSADLPFQDFHRGFCAAAGRSLSAHRIAARRIGRLHGQRRIAQAVSREGSHAVVRESASAAEAGEGRLIADVVACIGTTDIVLGEVDR
jgi:NADH-quinone oxidoreductase subunit D